MMRKLAIASAALLLLAMAQPGRTEDVKKDTAAETAKKKPQPVDIESDRMEVLDKEKKAIFSGNVRAKRPDVTVTSDTLVVDFGETRQPDGTTKSEVTGLDASGHVKIVTQKQTITGDHAAMDPKANILVVTGNVVVTQGETVLRGPELHADLTTNRMEMSGGRVKGSFLPK